VWSRASAWLFALFYAALTVEVVPRARRLFGGKFGRRHRLAGALHLTMLVATAVCTLFKRCWFALDVLVGVTGIAATLTAAFDFERAHRDVKNAASGTLEEEATVTYSEMLEHSFYQGLNLLQILAFHVKRPGLGLVVVVTAPWLVRRKWFPVNKFSDNDTAASSLLYRVLYRVKKCQYVLYKHCLLHGLNVTVLLRRAPDELVSSTVFRLYWLGLTTSYVMEFFLQTLVKRRYMPQPRLLILNGALMLASSLAGLELLGRLYFFRSRSGHVDALLAAASLGLNFLRRYHDFQNTLALALAALLLR